MCSKDWIDIAVIASWIGIWTALVYFVPFGGI